jgi:hypothetical protein
MNFRGSLVGCFLQCLGVMDVSLYEIELVVRDL